uniref:Uncharacterized protein n=1 Tax=Candidatus Kentrum sp. FM TaxID=2126340 RepID=A0A450TQ52_9GAMM|nr:MAG: hypothetical protein BECKFM1743A_GA0114220_100591 [Candidatus Kentron sp. FM]VFJ70217.1 MAG: hypothetical protein BECKFM1743C_GA0114222_105481 [Candidatus Kentron sp. FM]
MSTEITEREERFFNHRGHRNHREREKGFLEPQFSLFFSVLLPGHFLFFLYAFHAVISIRYWFAIDIAIRYRYRSYPAFSIASSDIDSDIDPERTTTPVAVFRAESSVVKNLFFLSVFSVDIISPPPGGGYAQANSELSSEASPQTNNARSCISKAPLKFDPFVKPSGK